MNASDEQRFLTPFVGDKLLYLSREDVISCGITASEIIGALEKMFVEKDKGRIEMPPKIGVHTMPDALLHAMPAYVPSQRAVGLKWVGGYPNNHQKNLPYITGLLTLNDCATGSPICIMDCTWVTAKRTGAATALSAKFLARSDSRVVGILGCGVQGRSNLEALMTMFKLEKVLAYSSSLERSQKYAQEMTRLFDVAVIPVTHPREAVSESDIVVTAGPILRKPHGTIQPGWLPAGAFASLVDFDSYWHADALREVDKFTTDDVPQLQHYRDIGYFHNIPPIYCDLGELVTGREPGRQSPSERTMACNLGLALEDIVVAALIHHRALEAGVGTWLRL
jgi:ornithine cyclodeaminase/alanine dehydrogenase-like protein (mu-crystallin family)